MNPRKATIKITDTGIFVTLVGDWSRRDLDQAALAMRKEMQIQRSKRIVMKENSDE